ncbi:hypothetical protein UFOVP416_52, partial [uncultured Caudovirales phage]
PSEGGLEAAIDGRLTGYSYFQKTIASITALRSRLAQPEQEPVEHTTGHCENHKQKGGCQLHNLQCGWPDCDRKPITATQPEQEPVAWRDHVEQRLLTWRQSFVNRSGDQLALDDFMDKQSLDDLVDFVCDEYTTPPQRKPEQEPVAWIDEFGNVFPLGAQRGPKHLNEPMKPLYTTPPQRKPLTVVEIMREWRTANDSVVDFARAIEAAHGIKGEA